MRRICTQCYNIDEEKIDTVMRYVMIILLVVFVITSLLLYIAEPLIDEIGLSITAIIWFAYFIAKKPTNICPKCKNETLIPIDHQIAQKIIQQNELIVESKESQI